MYIWWGLGLRQWLAALQALGMPKDSPLRNPKQIPRPVLATLV